MMQSIKLSELSHAIPDAQLLGDDAVFNRCAFDSRKVKSGDLFVALKGDNFDGHAFLPEIIAKDAAAALVSQTSELGIAQVHVPDTLVALGYLGKFNRDKFSGAVIGLTGSAGKTTTKEMIAAVLREKGSVVATQGNLNNEIGVPQTLLRLSPEHKYAVVEMGAAKLNDIEYLMQFVQPNIGVILNVLPAHIEGFGSLENISKTKFQIIKKLNNDGIGVVNLDDQFSQQWLDAAEDKQLITYSAAGKASPHTQHICAQDIERFAWGSRFKLHFQNEESEVNLPVPGQHNIANALAAGAVGLALGLTLTEVTQGLSKFAGVQGRLHRLSGLQGSEIIDDSYNANPQAVKQAIDVLSNISGQKILVLGDMLELGQASNHLHAEIGEYAQGKVDKLWTVGKHCASACETFGEFAKHFDSQQALIDYAQNTIQMTDVVLVKGSRGSRMENVVRALVESKQESR